MVGGVNMKVGTIVCIVGGRGHGYRRIIKEAILLEQVKQSERMMIKTFGDVAKEAYFLSKAINNLESMADQLKLINKLPEFEVTSSQLKIQLKAARKKKRGFLEIQQLERELSKKLREERMSK
jgi:alcohol dehydrogenase YqhD (iron-dependent ADH family)